MHRRTLLLAVALLGGCASLAPQYEQTPLPVVEQWPIPPQTPAAAPAAGGEMAADIGWRDFFVDPQLERLIGLALEHNRDLRIAVLNIDRARALYRIRRADRLPTVGVNGQYARVGTPDDGPAGGAITEQYSVELGVTAFELDLFGRVRNLSDAALQQFLAQEQAQRATQLALIAEVARVYLTLAADRELLRLARETLETELRGFDLIERQHELGAVSGLVLQQARTTVETARVDVARFAGDVAQDTNALALLVGTPLQDALLPDSFDVEAVGLPSLPVALPSEVLLRRPDVRQAEHLLRAAHAEIGAARAAFFPSISLTGSLGTASDDLSGLFESGSRTWSFLPRIDLPIFDFGRRRAALEVSQADREIALARYEQAIQAGFREVADALALTATLAQQREAQAALVEATESAYQLSQQRYRAGLDSFLTTLDSQRAWYRAQQALISIRLAEAANRAVLYTVLGGGWLEQAPPRGGLPSSALPDSDSDAPAPSSR